MSTTSPATGCLTSFIQPRMPRKASFLFVNRGDGTFEDRSARAGRSAQVGALNCNHADYDNDGDLDVLLLRGGWEAPLALLCRLAMRGMAGSPT